MVRIALASNLSISRVVHGHWRLSEWNLTPQQLLSLVQGAMELGVTTFDHADIYGGYTCEQLFGNALALKPELRSHMQIVTKCGIKLMSAKYPERTVKHYDYSYAHIVDSVNASLKNFGTSYIDLLLLHRPAPFINPEEVAKAFSELQQNGKVLQLGVSNFTPSQYQMLSSYLDVPLVTNQVEISAYCLDNFKNGNIDSFLANRIRPMAWSPLAGGRLLNPTDSKGERLYAVLTQIAAELGVSSIDAVAYAWLLKHPVGIVPVVGTRSIERIATAVNALELNLSLEQWYRIYVASEGVNVP